MATRGGEDLLKLLAEKTGALEAMRASLEEEQRLIIQARPDRLEENTRQALELISGMNLLKNRFKELLLRTGNELGLGECDNLSSVMAGMDGETRSRLQAMQGRCFAAVDAINRLLVANEGLLKNSLDIIDGSLSLFSRLLGGCETYGAAGRLQNGKAQAGILCREI